MSRLDRFDDDEENLKHKNLEKSSFLFSKVNIYLPQEVMFSPLSVHMSVARISQKVLDRRSCKFVERLAIDQRPTPITVNFG